MLCTEEVAPCGETILGNVQTSNRRLGDAKLFPPACSPLAVWPYFRVAEWFPGGTMERDKLCQNTEWGGRRGQTSSYFIYGDEKIGEHIQRQEGRMEHFTKLWKYWYPSVCYAELLHICRKQGSCLIRFLFLKGVKIFFKTHPSQILS